MARNDFENNLTALNYDGGFFEIFRDESKIVNANEVAIKTLEDGG